MLTFEAALAKVMEYAQPLAIRTVRLTQSLGYALAEEIEAQEPVPLFSNSAVDGFAVYAGEVQSASPKNPVGLSLQGTVRAGEAPKMFLQNKHAVRIFTGGLIPQGADAVVMQEFVTQEGNSAVVQTAVRKGENIRGEGEEFPKGTTVFAVGTVITPAVVGMLATLGYPTVKVFQKPKAAVIVTGDELRPPSATLRPGQIRDSNSYALRAALTALGIPSPRVLRVKDDKHEIRQSFSLALASSDVVLSAGGVSVGDYDFVKEVLDKLKVEAVFTKIAVKPGQPNFFGIYRAQGAAKLVFGLPGNPVSALVSFHTLVRPACQRLMGYRNSAPVSLKVLLTKDLHKKPGRLEWVRASLVRDAKGELTVTPAARQGSHMLGGLTAANCLIIFPPDLSTLSAGNFVDVQLLDWDN